MATWLNIQVNTMNGRFFSLDCTTTYKKYGLGSPYDVMLTSSHFLEKPWKNLEQNNCFWLL